MTPSCWRARAAGRRRAFGELVRRHQQAALRLAAVIGGSTEEAKDIVQDAFVKVHAQPRLVSGFRFGALVDAARRRQPCEESRPEPGPTPASRRPSRQVGTSRSPREPDAAAERRLDHDALIAALQRLSRDDRDVLGSRFVAELSEAETAEVLGIALGTVKSRTSRALGRLQHEFEMAGSAEVER